jgi:hypothetical protein
VTDFIRHSDWQDRLSNYLDNAREKRFAYGKHDCASFTAGAVKALTGVDVYEDFAGSYASKREAAKALREKGAGTLLRTVTAKLGKRLPAAQARKGDIVLRDRSTLGVCVGRWSVFVGNPQGGSETFVYLPTIELKACWRVG